MTKIKLIAITSTIVLISTMMIFSASSLNASAQDDDDDAGSSSGAGTTEIPSWFQNVAGFYSQGAMSGTEFANNIEYLIKEAIVVVPSSANYAQATTIERSLEDMNNKINMMESMIGNDLGGIEDPQILYRLDKLETMFDLGFDGVSTSDRLAKAETAPIGDPTGIINRLDKLETMFDLGFDGVSTSDRLDKLETMFDLGFDGVSTSDRLAEVESAMIILVNSKPVPIDELLGSMSNRLDKLESTIARDDTSPSISDRLAKLEKYMTVGGSEGSPDMKTYTNQNKVTIKSGASSDVIAKCNSGDIALSGGYYSNGGKSMNVYGDSPQPSGWKAIGYNSGSSSYDLTAYVLCMSP